MLQKTGLVVLKENHGAENGRLDDEASHVNSDQSSTAVLIFDQKAVLL